MKGAIETMVATVVLTLFVVVGTSYVILSLNLMKVQEFHSQVITCLESADYAPTVVEQLFADAKSNGYNQLQIELLTSLEGEPYAKVSLAYAYTIPILQMDMTYDLVGYAR
jgi:hypothetical protein